MEKVENEFVAVGGEGIEKAAAGWALPAGVTVEDAVELKDQGDDDGVRVGCTGFIVGCKGVKLGCKGVKLGCKGVKLGCKGVRIGCIGVKVFKLSSAEFEPAA